MRVRRGLFVLGCGVLLLAVTPPAPAAPGGSGKVFLIQGIVGSTWDFEVDGTSVGEGLEAKQIVGPLDLRPGRHTVSATSADGDAVEAMVRVPAGKSQDVVLHVPVDASKNAVITSFVNDVSPVRAGTTRLSIAHTAAVGPADIKVDGKVLFSDVASGEELTVVVPADTYRVAVLPSATDDPPVLGPVDLPVPAGKSMRVYAVGVAERGTMDAIVHAVDVPVKGSAAAPGDVPGGSGGQHDTSPLRAVLAGGGELALLGSLLVVGLGIRRRTAPDPA